jgi:AraC-like DNA-binding protein
MISFNLLDVLELKQEHVTMYNRKRNFNALSFRLKSDTVLKCRTGVFQMSDSYVSFVPSNLDYSCVSKIDELIVIHFEAINCNAWDIEFFEAENPKAFQKLFTSILECWNHKEVGYRYKCSAIFNEILALCYLENYNPKPIDSKIKKSVKYLLKHYNDFDLSIKAIAEQSFMSEVYFRKLFKAEYGISPQKYIIALRIQHAKELISTGYYSLKEIALMSGYSDYKYFSTEFKKQVGVSPSDYAYNYNK